jgi:hypothetical protein
MGIEAIRSDLQREKFRLSRLAVAPVSAKADLELQSRLRVLKIRELPRAYWDIHTAKRCHATLGPITNAWSTPKANNPIAMAAVRNRTRFSIR